MRKKLYLDLPLGMILLGGSFLLGGMLGFFFASIIPQEEDLSLFQYYADYFTAVKSGDTEAKLWTVFWGNVKAPILAFFLGFSVLGLWGLPLLFLVESFTFTFSVSTLCRVLGVSGLLPAFVLFGLPALWWVPMFFLLGLQSFHTALSLRNKTEAPFNRGDFLRAVCFLFATALNIAYEYLLLPSLLQGIL